MPKFRRRSKLQYLMCFSSNNGALQLAMALRTDKWLRKDPSDHRSISLPGSIVGGSFRGVVTRALGVHVGRCIIDDFVVSDLERDSVPD